MKIWYEKKGEKKSNQTVRTENKMKNEVPFSFSFQCVWVLSFNSLFLLISRKRLLNTEESEMMCVLIIVPFFYNTRNKNAEVCFVVLSSFYFVVRYICDMN